MSFDNNFEQKNELLKEETTPEQKVDFLDIDHTNSESIQNEFRENHCENGMLKHKNMNVNPDMTSHVFSDVNFKHEKCNVCSPNCRFSIIETKFKAESNVKSKCSKNV